MIEVKHVCLLLALGSISVGYVIGSKNNFGGTEGAILGFGISTLVMSFIFFIAKMDSY